MDFVAMYVKTEYCLLNSTCKIKELIPLLHTYNYSTCCMVGDKTLYGVIPFYKACIANNIKPIIGLKINLKINQTFFEVILYAMNNMGYRNLLKVSTVAAQSTNPLSLDELKAYSLGICSCLVLNDSSLNKLYINATLKIDAICGALQTVFDEVLVGFTAFYDKLKNVYFESAEKLNAQHVRCVALPVVSFLHKEDYQGFELLQKISMGKEYVVPEYQSEEYLNTIQELGSIYNGAHELIQNASDITKGWGFSIEFGRYTVPVFDSSIPGDSYLQQLSKLGLDKRLKQDPRGLDQRRYNIYMNRLYYELDVISKMGFSDYFLIVFDYVRFAKKQNIFVGLRGSGGASLVCYSLGITDVDPIDNHLFFERFLNVERITMPDIDIDFEDTRRNEVISYVQNKYGKQRVCHIATFGTYQVKMALNDCKRIIDLSDIRFDELMHTIESGMKKFNTTSLQFLIEHDEDLIALITNYEDIRTFTKIGAMLQDLPRNVSTHPAGIIVSKDELTRMVPLEMGPDDILQSQFEAGDCESLGLLKMDFLGLKNLTNVRETIDAIKIDYPNFAIPQIPNDFRTYKLLQAGDVLGVFQLESKGMQKLIIDIKPKNIEDITAAVALYRPGPKDRIPFFIDCKNGIQKPIYPHNDLIPILKDTYGTIVYQEQIMLICQKFAGYSLGKADILRRAISKKNKDVLEKERIEFVKGSIQKGYQKETAEEIYNYIVKFADYGFNKSHAVAYAKLVYLTAYLKSNYFLYYFGVLMDGVIGVTTELARFIQMVKRKNYTILSPNINTSLNRFKVCGNALLFPLTGIKGISKTIATNLLDERNKKQFLSFEDFIYRTKEYISGLVFENLIYAGALDCFQLTKKAMISNYKEILSRSEYSFVENVVPTTYDNSEFSYGELLINEKIAIGVNLLYNIFYQYGDYYNKYQLLHLKQAVEGQRIRTLGMITSIKEIKTKTNELMAFITLEDDFMAMEATIFQDLYKRVQPLINHEIYMVSGRVQKRNEVIQIVLDQMKKI